MNALITRFYQLELHSFISSYLKFLQVGRNQFHLSLVDLGKFDDNVVDFLLDLVLEKLKESHSRTEEKETGDQIITETLLSFRRSKRPQSMA